MRKSSPIIFFFIFLLFIGCSSSFISKTKKRNIKLNSFIKSGILIGLENSKSIIQFNQKDLIDLYEYDIAKGDIEISMDLVYKISSFKSDTIFNAERLKGTLPFFEYELKFHELLKKGKAVVLLKNPSKKLRKIKYKYTRDKLGGESAYFYSIDNIKFYQITLSFGE